MIKTMIQFSTTIADNDANKWEIDINVPVGCPIAIVKEANLQCLKWLGQVEDHQKAQQEQLQQQEAPIAEVENVPEIAQTA